MQNLASPSPMPVPERRWRDLVSRGEVPLLLVRHGQTAYNQQRRFVGRTDIPLDEDGLHQARRLGERLTGLPRAALYSSPLLRARQTAAALGSPVVVTGLEELDQGELEGLHGQEAFQRYPAFFERWAADPADVRVPGGETLRECQARSLAALADLAHRHEPQLPVVVVAHQMVLASVVLHAVGLPLRFLRLVKQGNTALNLLGWHPARGLRVYRLNDTGHLDN
ncbi:MAG: histidine phosphatase family protein [Alphaproteobacteria bacterium]|nr:histidine phosphatase family protein [Alphaproteobacteria bacterium]